MVKEFDPQFVSAGRFISRGHGKHPIRKIDSLELIYVLSGTLEIFEENKTFQVVSGERLFLFPGRCHGGLAAYLPELSFFWLHVVFSHADGYSFFESRNQHAAASFPDFFSAYIQLLLSEQQRSLLSPDSNSIQNLNELSCILLRESLREKNETLTRCPLADTAEQYIKLHFDESLTTTEIAAHLQCNPDYLSRTYTRIRGLTIGDAIRKERIRKASSLLENSEKSVKQIAFETGYNDVSYFRKQFFRECSMTPKEYRNLLRKGHINTE